MSSTAKTILAAAAAALLFGTGRAAAQASQNTPAHTSHADHAAHATVASGQRTHDFTLNVYISDSGVEPAIVFVPLGRRVQLVLRNRSLSEHHYRVAGLAARDLLWSEPPSAAALPAEDPDDDGHAFHHTRDFVTRRAPSPAGIRVRDGEVHAYVSRMRVLDVLLFTPTRTGTFPIRCDLHGETLGKMIVFDAGLPAAPETFHVAASGHAHEAGAAGDAHAAHTDAAHAAAHPGASDGAHSAIPGDAHAAHEAPPAGPLALPHAEEPESLAGPRSRQWLAWLGLAAGLLLAGLAVWTVRQDKERRSNTLRWARATALVLLGFVAAWSWLFVVSRWGPEQRTDILTFQAGVTSQVMRALLKPAQGAAPHDHEAPSISGIYATPEYFLMTSQSEEAARVQPDQFNVFYVFEDSHAAELPSSPPALTLRLPDGRQLSPVDTAVLRDSSHHRATVARFPARDAQGRPLPGGDTSFLELAAEENAEAVAVQHAAMTAGMPMAPAAQVMRWDLPIVYPQNLRESGLSLPALLALLAGLLAVLSPCLLQLTIYYTFALTGINVQQTPAGLLEARKQILATALYFIAGFTVVFTAAGALAGMVGQRLQSSGIMDHWSRPLAIAAGVGILLLGLWVGARSGAPGLCRLPLGVARRARGGWLDKLKVMFMGSAFAIGCSTCFGGALFISLMIYVGVAGSPAVGAAALFLFSLGMAIPYLLAAFFLSRALPLMNSLQKAAPVVGLVCSVVLIFFGVILIADYFHVPSNLLYRLYLGL